MYPPPYLASFVVYGGAELRPSGDDPAVRPDICIPAFAADFRVNEGDEVDVAVVVPGIRHAVRAVVVVLGEVDGRVPVVQRREDQRSHLRIASQPVLRPLVVSVDVWKREPVVHRSVQGEIAVRDLVVILRHRPGRPRPVEKLGLKVARRIRVGARVGEFHHEQRHLRRARHGGFHRAARQKEPQVVVRVYIERPRALRDLHAVLASPLRFSEPGLLELEGGFVVSHPLEVGVRIFDAGPRGVYLRPEAG